MSLDSEAAGKAWERPANQQERPVSSLPCLALFVEILTLLTQKGNDYDFFINFARTIILKYHDYGKVFRPESRPDFQEDIR